MGVEQLPGLVIDRRDDCFETHARDTQPLISALNAQ